LEWKNGTRLPITTMYVDEGVIPVGMTWAMNPIPVISGQHQGTVARARALPRVRPSPVHCVSRSLAVPSVGKNLPITCFMVGCWGLIMVLCACVRFGAGCTNVTNSNFTNVTDSNGMLCRQFDPPCSWDDGWSTTPGTQNSNDVMGACSNNWLEGVIVDYLIIPDTLVRLLLFFSAIFQGIFEMDAVLGCD
jgi:hypothetical protein